MRFDDSLDTVLAAGVGGTGADEATWRQLVDLIGRRRGTDRPEALVRLRAMRGQVSSAVRLATARGLERADPPAGLVGLFADDEPSIAAPVLRSARLDIDEWLRLLPEMGPVTRGVLRLRRDLPGPVVAALDAFGPVDLTLASDPAGTAAPHAPSSCDEGTIVAPPGFVPPEDDSFVAVAAVARELPVVAEAIRREDAASARPQPSGDDFQIAALVARIERHRQAAEEQPPQSARTSRVPALHSFRFETDAAGLIRWVDGVERTPLIGLSLAAGEDGRPVAVDGSAAGALARRGTFSDARLAVGGNSSVAGEWRISGVPVFDRSSGRFTGYRGTARRPRTDEDPRPAAGETTDPNRASDMLRQLVHELRTPTNAISGFAEMIEHEMLGPVAPPYREQAGTIRGQAAGLLGAIDDLDTAARIESRRLDLRGESVELAPLLARVLVELEPLAELRGAVPAIVIRDAAVAQGDATALHRLLSRFLAAVFASAAAGETLTGELAQAGSMIELSVRRPRGFVVPQGGLFEADAEVEAAIAGGPLLGTGFGFRLARRLAGELGGGLEVEADRLFLRMRAASAQDVGQVSL